MVIPFVLPKSESHQFGGRQLGALLVQVKNVYDNLGTEDIVGKMRSAVSHWKCPLEGVIVHFTARKQNTLMVESVVSRS